MQSNRILSARFLHYVTNEEFLKCIWQINNWFWNSEQ